MMSMSIRSLKPFWAILRKNLTGGLQYRAGTWSKLATNAFWGCARSAILIACYKYGSADTAIDMQQAVTLIWLQQIALNLLPGFGMDWTVWSNISSGGVGYELLRPMDIYGHWYANAIAVKLAPFLLSTLPMATLAFLMPGDLGMSLPASPMHLVACLLTLLTGLLVSCTAICMSYAMLLDVNVGNHPAGIFMTITQILAGSILPLQLWPDSMQTFLRLQPFAGMMDLPLRFYIGSEPLTALPGVLALQLVWGIVLAFLGRSWINRNLKKLVIQGG